MKDLSVVIVGGGSGLGALLAEMSAEAGAAGVGVIDIDGEAAEGSTLIAQEASDGTSVHAGDTWHTVALAPLGEGFDGEVMGKLFGDICNDDRRALDALRFEVDTDVVAIDWCLVVGNSVVADERCCKNEDLSPV